MINENSYEMDELRSQIALLKVKLDKQQIVNDDIFRQAMRNNLDYISRRYRLGKIVSIATLFAVPYVFDRMLGASMPLIIFTELMMLVSIVISNREQSLLPRPQDMNTDLLSMDLRMEQFTNRINRRFWTTGLPFTVIFLTWLFLDVGNGRIQLISVMIGFAGGVIAGICSLKRLKRRSDEIRDNIRKIKELQNGN